ncbi:hypothetical protein HaLaN_12337, partial [Haematococcus lacustris]
MLHCSPGLPTCLAVVPGWQGCQGWQGYQHRNQAGCARVQDVQSANRREYPVIGFTNNGLQTVAQGTPVAAA